MSAAWVTVAGLAVGTVVIKAGSPTVLVGRTLPPRLAAVLQLLPAAVLSALVVNDALTDGARGLTLDARGVGLAAAALAVLLRLPMVVVIVVAAASTALVRALA
ncbi:MAG: AzlD domain-containing protein [Frankiaceae bacterium]